MKKLICLLSILAIAVCFAKISYAAEHPGEHPGTPAKTEHQEHPGKTHEAEHPGESAEHPGKKAMLSAKEIIAGIKGHINEITQAHGGYYPLRDSKEGKDLRLKLVRVHGDRVSYIKKDDAYFACTDFKTDDGTATYDVDFWMKKGADGKLKVYKTAIHKKDGSPRFTYKDDEIVEVK